MAAGIGSRFGGLKQTESIGPSGEYIMDYSIYDAIRAGFTKIVFIIKKENYALFKETIGKRIEPYIKVAYCFQTMDMVPKGVIIPRSRIKPLGTAHAILCCKDKVKEPFAVINADDFYGKDAFIKASDFLKELCENEKHYYGMISYFAGNTIVGNKPVKRGICKVENGYLEEIVESKLEKVEGKMTAYPLNHTPPFEVKNDAIVSMNMFLFTPSIFDLLEKEFLRFLKENKNDIGTCEFILPEVLRFAIQKNYVTLEVIQTNAKWFGVTYYEDLAYVKENIKELIKKEEYKKDLWN